MPAFGGSYTDLPQELKPFSVRDNSFSHARFAQGTEISEFSVFIIGIVKEFLSVLCASV